MRILSRYPNIVHAQNLFDSYARTSTRATHIYMCPFIGQVEAVLREAARGCQPGNIKDSKTIEKKNKEIKRGRGRGRARGRGGRAGRRGRGARGRGRGGRNMECADSEPNVEGEEQDSEENLEMKLLETEDREIRRSLNMEDELEQDEIPEVAWDSKAFKVRLHSPFSRLTSI